MDISIEEIRTFLARRSRKVISDPTLKRAGVLMTFFTKGNSWHLLMTKRSDDVEHHKGQISFPGGAAVPGDEDIIATALRETEEEIGLPAGSVEVLGRFDDHETPTGFIITPVVGYVRRIPALTPRQEEVEEILEVPVSLFVDKSKERVVQMKRMGKTVDAYFFDFGKHEIWGATARISRDFLTELSRAKKPL